jgi:cytochrome c peroxidase
MTTAKLSFLLRPLVALLFVTTLISCGDQVVPGGEAPEVGALEQPITAVLTCQAPGTGFGEVAVPPGVGGVLPFTPLTSLRLVPNPVLPPNPRGGFLLRDDLVPYIADLNAAIQLGKALFWDVQAGSDNKVSCATCHFQAGGDIRTLNTLATGANGTFDGYAVNTTLAAADFPFTDMAVGKNIDNIAGSQGVRRATFQGISNTGAELVSAVTDPVFGTTRRVTDENAPTTVNAVFNHRNFFNGRAQPEFNGVNPWGSRDGTARVWQVIDTLGNAGQIDIRIQNASLASQAVGPPLNDVEMSATGRTFPELGKKMLLVKPLGLQRVDKGDSVLGVLANAKATGAGFGLKTTYAAMIQKAFQPRWWNSNKTALVNGKSYTVMQANFSLYWGLAIMLYEATLVSDNTPMDRYVATRVLDLEGKLVSHTPSLLTPVVTRLAAQGITIPLPGGGTRAVTANDILLGLQLFEKPIPLPGEALATAPAGIGQPAGTGVGCAFCHIGAETTGASVLNLTAGNEPAGDVLRNLGFDLRMERMFMGVRNPPPTVPQPPPPVPAGTDIVDFDSATYAVNVLSINGVAVPPQPVKVNVYDVGWYNIGLRPTAEDLGVGGLDAFGRPLSWVQWFQTVLFDPSSIRVPGGGLGCTDVNGNPVTPPAAPLTSPFAGEVLNPATQLPLLSGPLRKTEGTDVAGSFKTSSLRNVELNGPYFHTGGYSTLWQVVEFYDDGGNFQNPTLSPLIRPLGLTFDQRAAVVSFLLALTDDRVMYQRAPFDHPELPIPAGTSDTFMTMPAVGAVGSATPLPTFMRRNPFSPQ